MNRIPTQPLTFEQFADKQMEVFNAVNPTIEQWIQQEAAKGAGPDFARGQAAGALLSAALNQYFKLCNIPADKGADLAIKVAMVLGAGISQIKQEMGHGG